MTTTKAAAALVYVVTTTGFLWFGMPTVTPQTHALRETDIENSRANTALIVADIRPKLFGDLPPSEHRIYNEIQFSVSPEDKIMNAYATRTAGVRQVILTEAIGRATELNADAFLIEQLYHKPGFLGDYMSFVCEQYQKNYKRYWQGLPASRIPSPYDFAHWSDKDLSDFYSDADVNRTRTIVVGGAFAFLLAHEVAHHVKGHVDHPASNKAEQRQKEVEADSWAIDLLVKKKLNPVDGIIPLLFFYFTDQNPVSAESMSDHPADERRLLAMYEGLSERLPSFKPYFLNGVSYETARKQVDTALELLRTEIEAGEKGRSARRSGSQTASGSYSLTGDNDNHSGFCDDLSSYVSAAQRNFAALRGPADPDGGGEAFYARRGVAGFSDCTVWVFRDRSVEPTASCDRKVGDFESLRSSIQGCLGPGWSSRTHTGEYVFSGPNGISVRLRRKSSGALELWVDSPSRD
jgi:hypothetical protein